MTETKKIAICFLTTLYLEKRDPALSQKTEPDAPSPITLAELIGLYEPWVLAHRKSGKITLRILNSFKDFYGYPF